MVHMILIMSYDQDFIIIEFQYDHFICQFKLQGANRRAGS